MYNKLLVLGLGNTLQTDEGIGIHVVNRLKEIGSLHNAKILDGGTLSFNLAEPIEDTDQLIVVDTAELDAPPGSVKVFEGMEMDAFITHGKKTSAHEVGLKDVLGVVLLQGKLPCHRALIGIQPEKFGWGDKPTENVAKAIPKACQKVFEIAENWKV